jgi:hypothetical protein
MNIQRHVFSLIAGSLIAMPMTSQADSFSISLNYDIFDHNYYKPHHYSKPVHVPVGYKQRYYHHQHKRHYKPYIKHHYRPRSYYQRGYQQPRHFNKHHGYNNSYGYKGYQKRGRHGYDQHRERRHGRPDFKYRDQRAGHHRR